MPALQIQTSIKSVRILQEMQGQQDQNRTEGGGFPRHKVAERFLMQAMQAPPKMIIPFFISSSHSIIIILRRQLVLTLIDVLDHHLMLTLLLLYHILCPLHLFLDLPHFVVGRCELAFLVS